MSIDTRQFRSALGTFATGVTIVTTHDGAGNDIGLTVNSFSSVSLDPPMVLWSLAKKSQSRQAFMDGDSFAVHILAADQSDLATRFASPVERFSGLEIERGEHGQPLLSGCSARFECKTVSRYEGGDHDIFVGEVTSYEHFGRPALVFHSGRFAVSVEKSGQSSATVKSPDELGRNSVTQILASAYYQMELAIRPKLASHNLSEAEYFSLAAMALTGPCSMASIAEIVGVSGLQVTPWDMQRLEDRGLVISTSADELTLQLSPAGRELYLFVAAASKAVEEDAITDFSYSEIEALKQLLRKIIRRTKPINQNGST